MAPLLFHNFSGRDLPDYSRHAFNCMLVENGRISATGMQPSAWPNARRFDLQGATVFSAFSDAHVHATQTGIALSGVQLETATSLDQVFTSLAQEAANNEYVLGWGLQESRLKEGRLPNSDELNAIAPDNFVWVARQDLHSAVLNRQALVWAQGLIPSLQAPAGLIKGNDYNQLCYLLIDKLSPAFKQQGLKRLEQHCFAQGVATIHALEGSNASSADSLAVAEFSQHSSLHTVIYHQSADPSLPVQQNWVGMGGCLLVDGALGTRTAALHSAYHDAPDCFGNLYLDGNAIASLLATAQQHNLQLALHAIGDRAIDTAIEAYAQAGDKWGKKALANRIEHFIMPSERALKLARDHEISISMQPAFDRYWGGESGLYASRLGPKRARLLHPFKTMLDLGIQLAAGSDSPVTPISPITGLAALMLHHNPSERLSLNAALALFISEPHRLSGEQTQRGQLKTGFHADFVCFAQDPFRVLPSQIADLRVSQLFIAGQQVYSA